MPLRSLSLPEMTDRDARRFWSKVALPDENGCMLWMAGKSSTGYGQFRLGEKPRRAHRVTYVFAYGEHDARLALDHLCRNRACVSPDHLEPVTIGENNRRGNSPAHVTGREGVCRRGHPLDEMNTYTDASGRRCRTCRREYQRSYRLRKKAS